MYSLKNCNPSDTATSSLTFFTIARKSAAVPVTVIVAEPSSSSLTEKPRSPGNGRMALRNNAGNNSEKLSKPLPPALSPAACGRCRSASISAPP